MAQPSFTLYNLYTSALTYQGTTIPANSSFTPVTAQDQFNFASDASLIADLQVGYVGINLGSGSGLLVGAAAVQALVNYRTFFDASGYLITTSPVFQYRNITSNTTTLVKSGAGILKSIVVNNQNQLIPTIAIIYDSITASGTKMFTLTSGNSVVNLNGGSSPGAFSTGPLDVVFNTGLTVVTSNGTSTDITLIYR